MTNVTDHDLLPVDSEEARSSPAHGIRVGCAGWVIPREAGGFFTSEGQHLERYACVLNCCEINFTLYRSHKEAIWTPWRQSVPPEFRFSVKMPRALTHEGALNCNSEVLLSFLREIAALGEKLGGRLDSITSQSRVVPGAHQRFPVDASRQLFGGRRLRTAPQQLVWGRRPHPFHCRTALIGSATPFCAALMPARCPSLVSVQYGLTS